MSKKQKEKTVTIEGKEYKESDLTELQINFINHITDLDNKIRNARHNLEQLQFGRNCYMKELNISLMLEEQEKKNKSEDKVA